MGVPVGSTIMSVIIILICLDEMYGKEEWYTQKKNENSPES